MPHKEAEETKPELKQSDLPREPILLEGPPPDKPEIEKREVAGLDEEALGVVCDLEEAQAGQEAEEGGGQSARLPFGRPGGDGRFEEASAGVEAWESVARTGDEAEDLGAGVEEVEDLRDEEEAERL